MVPRPGRRIPFISLSLTGHVFRKTATATCYHVVAVMEAAILMDRAPRVEPAYLKESMTRNSGVPSIQRGPVRENAGQNTV